MLKFVYSLDRIAIISDEEWLRSAARLESALLPGVVYQVYDDDEAEAALAWISEEEEAPHCGAFNQIDFGKPGIAAFEITGRLDETEAERGIAMARLKLAEPECKKLLIIIKAWHGFEADTMFSKGILAGKLDLMNQIDRYAIVGGPGWIGGMAEVMGKLIKPTIRAFDLDEQSEAIAWLAEDSPQSPD